MCHVQEIRHIVCLDFFWDAPKRILTEKLESPGLTERSPVLPLPPNQVFFNLIKMHRGLVSELSPSQVV
jgi:hypothetical protein